MQGPTQHYHAHWEFLPGECHACAPEIVIRIIYAALRMKINPKETQTKIKRRCYKESEGLYPIYMELEQSLVIHKEEPRSIF